MGKRIHTNLTRAFTMIELIFVIVIISILAAVALSKLSLTRDDAKVSTCVHEIGQFIKEITTTYTKSGYVTFKTTAITDITNIKVNTTGTPYSGIKESGTSTLDTTGVTYQCEGGDVAKFVSTISGNTYQLSMTLQTPSSPPAAIQTVEQLRINFAIPTTTSTKKFQL